MYCIKHEDTVLKKTLNDSWYFCQKCKIEEDYAEWYLDEEDIELPKKKRERSES